MPKVKVEFRNVALSYGKTRVLRDIDLVIEPGEFFALLGPSGSGKSTLLRVLAGFARPDSGQVLVDGKDISGVQPWDRDIGMVFQNYALWPHMTVWRNVAFGLEERRLPRAVIERKVEAALNIVGLGDFGNRRPNQLSGGQQQRVALARTIAIEPKVLLLDEPLSNLDAILRVRMRGELLALQRKLGITTIFVTHDQAEALSISDRVAVLDGGVIQQVGAPSTLYDHPANRFIASFVGTINLITGEAFSTPDGLAFRSVETGDIPLPASVTAAPGRGEIAFRPHTLTVIGGHAETAADTADLHGTIELREFLGEFVRYKIRSGGNEIIADQAHRSNRPDFAEGDAVTVRVDISQIRFLPA
jgi:iron(III) transport system ATP-binding protein